MAAPGMSMVRVMRVAALTLALTALAAGGRAQPASAGVCGAVGFVGGWAGRTCSAVSHPGRVIKAGKSLATGHPGKAVKAVLSSGAARGALGLAALVTWVVVGAKTALNATAGVIARTTSPQLRTTWFSGTYWRMSAIATLLTLPFLFAASVQAVMRSDLALLARSALGYLPLSLLGVSLAAPLTMLLLAASDQISAAVSTLGVHTGTQFLAVTGHHVAVLSALDHSPFLIFFVALLASAAALALWIEMLMRDAAVYIVVLMLPLAFAAMVWPARRIWATRTAELLVALILSKFAVVAILALGAAALGQAGGAGGIMIGLVLVTLAAFSPWALLRLVPLAELASGAAGHLSGELRGPHRAAVRADDRAQGASDWAGGVVSGMRDEATTISDASAAETAVGARSTGGRFGRTREGQPRNGTTERDRGGAATEGAAEPDSVAQQLPERQGVAGRNEVSDPGGASDLASISDAQPSEPYMPHDPPASAVSGALPPDGHAPSDAGELTRLPGLPEIYHADDLTWDPVGFGPGDGSAGPLWRKTARADAAAESDGAAGEDGIDQPAGNGHRHAGAATAEDHDPLPAGQQPEGGRL